jgi:hypothetical protein
MPGAAETLAEHRERKRIAADRFAEAQRKLIKRYWDEIHLPALIRTASGMCTGINTSKRTISVTYDELAEGVQLPADMPVGWDRPILTAREVVDKRVKVFIAYPNGVPVVSLAAIMS